VRNFAAKCAAVVASDTLRLVFVFSASNLEHDYLGLLAVLEASEESGPGAARPAQPPAQSAVRERVHALLGSSTWRGRWLGVLDNLPAPEAMEAANLDWLLKEFPWADGRTIITTRAAAWTDAEAMSVAFDAVDGDDKQHECAECGQTPPVLFKGTKCGNCREVYYCCRKCQQKAWKVHKLMCRQIVADRRSVADIVGLHVGNFAKEEACSWMKKKVLQWKGDAEGILLLVRYLKCFPLAVALAAARACSDNTATPAMYLDALRRAGSKRAKGRGTTEEYPECFPDVVKLLLDKLLQSHGTRGGRGSGAAQAGAAGHGGYSTRPAGHRREEGRARAAGALAGDGRRHGLRGDSRRDTACGARLDYIQGAAARSVGRTGACAGIEAAQV